MLFILRYTFDDLFLLVLGEYVGGWHVLLGEIEFAIELIEVVEPLDDVDVVLRGVLKIHISFIIFVFETKKNIIK